MTNDEAATKFLEIAAQIWCQQQHSHKEMDAELVESIASALRAAKAEGLEEVVKALDTFNVEEPQSFTAMAFNDACRDLSDWCRQRAAAVRENKNNVRGGVVGTRRESIGSESCDGEQAKTVCLPRKRSAGALPVRSMPGIGTAGSNPAPSLIQNDKPCFENVWCSQCGNSFGPGHHGFSQCSDHQKAQP